MPLPQFMRERVEQANANLLHYQASLASGMSSDDWMMRFFAPADIVFLLYPDDAQADGLGLVVAKGRWRLEAALLAGVALECSTTSLVVGRQEEAMAMAIVYGDVPEPRWMRKSRKRSARKGRRS